IAAAAMEMWITRYASYRTFPQHNNSSSNLSRISVVDPVRTIEVEINADFDDRRRRWFGEKEAAKARRDQWQTNIKEGAKLNIPAPSMPENAEEPPAPQFHRLLVNDTTTEKLARLAAANRHGLVLARDELAGWLGSMDRYNSGAGGDRAFFLEAFGGRPYAIDRVKDPEPIRVPALSIGILGSIQPDRLASMLLAGDDDGLAARCLYSWPERRRPVRPQGQSDDQAAVKALRRLVDLQVAQGDEGGPAKPIVVSFAPDAVDRLQAWRERVADYETAASGLFMSWLGKLPGYAVRLAMIFELLWWCGDLSELTELSEPEQISEQAIEAAVTFLESYCLPMARRCFMDASLPEVERDARMLARWIMRQKPETTLINARELRQKHAIPGKVSASRYDEALSELAEAGWVRETPTRAGPFLGRKRKDWSVSPLLERNDGDL
ncbi:MAG: YfjI family protein, partial [Alphaproteobacteria bacterium]|nr:YfjI family protein [Alphaproteobacteria bacterium]